MRIMLTGAAGGIGSAIKEALADKAEVVALTRDDADLGSYEAIETLAQKISSGGPLDWIIFAHGYIDSQADFASEAPEEILKTFQLNTLSCMDLTRLLLGRLRPKGGVIFISSTAALSMNGQFPAYTASKAAINAFAQALARKYPEHAFYALCPGPTNTPMREKIANDAATSQSPSAVADAVKAVLSGAYQSGDIIAVRGAVASLAQKLL